MDTSEIEKEISDQIIIWVKDNPKATKVEIENKITQEIAKRNYLKEDWQAHYAMERIMIFIKEEFGINFNYAGFQLRLIAFIIDQIVVLGIAFLIGLFLGIIIPNIISLWTRDTWNIIGIGITWIYYASMESSQTQGTFGKMALGIKVTNLDGNKISFGRATGRFFSKIVSSVFLIGFFMIAFTKKKQGLHDKIAACLVVKKSKKIIGKTEKENFQKDDQEYNNKSLQNIIRNVSSNKRFCSYCGSAIDTDANFCRHCGEKNDGVVETCDTSKLCPFCKTKIGVDYEECPNCQRLLVEKISSDNQFVHEYQKPYHCVERSLFQRIKNFFVERINYPKLKIYSMILLGTIFVVWIFSSNDYSYDSGGTKAPLPPPVKQISNDLVELAPLSPAVSLSNGAILKKNSTYLQEDGELQIKNGTDLDAVAKLICDGTSILTVYIKANNIYTMRNISDGVYWLAFAQGLDWDSTIQKFRRNTQYSAFEDTFDFTTTEDNQYYYSSIFEVTLNPVIGGTAETNDISGNQFDQY